MSMVKDILEYAIKEYKKEIAKANQSEKFWHDQYIELAKEGNEGGRVTR